MTSSYEKFKKLIEEVKYLSPFELKDKLISLATDHEMKGVEIFLNAGRGNPNWTASTPRDAFFTLGHFAVSETKRVWNDGDLAGMPEKEGIADRFEDYCLTHKKAPGLNLLMEIVKYGIEKYKFDPDAWLFELVDGIIGDNYPVPDRMLIHIEKVVHDYLIREMGGVISENPTHDLFAVEGGTAAMCYIFDSLMANHLLEKESNIALMVPIFTPYLEIPHLSRYEFNVTEIHASKLDKDGRHSWQYPKEELDKLADSNIKLLCVVNPSNPPSVAIDDESMDYIKNIVKEKNPNLMIVTDDVYGTFTNNFKSFMVTIPYNTLGVYSFSKYFGVTGWRLGVIALSKENIFNKLISELPKEAKDDLIDRYSSLTTNPEEITFIDRIVADSRQVALNHTAGLSTPQQVQMAIFSMFALLDSNDTYKQQTKDICFRRKKMVYNNLTGLPMKEKDPYSASYYNEYDMLVWARLSYGEEFAQYLQKNRDPLEFLFELAEKYHIVLLNCGGFNGPKWSIRISFANLYDDQYAEIGKAINELFAQYAEDWKNSK
ncbi:MULTISPECIES: aspartate 4-decarboxylase [Clostridium]|uniref:Aminotransferase n=1 Tax=Clostridium cadaveris TaxID=1529 RepID=A0A1I2PIT6_9CLOT|nr:aspartate 4-decarboxylase [Clostridium cadaveris]MDM8311673.1 aspartate 4-decarboxylase [Clostridium cadaveris]MDU4953075.1 aspartate 4-decarboxylase [Clostridium sp.]NME64304.1 aspartate 4-decarboxylase [Clostridium cadaveris]SFG13556.1 aspartate 4-decarboxylase [Clostridium cadaveris]